MKRLITIFFFAVYLLSTTEACQVLKLPVVFQHFSEHRSENRHLTFLEFLDMHYMHGSPMDDDYERDMQLPFKTSVDIIFSIVPASVPIMVELSLVKPVEIGGETNFIYQHQFITSAYLANIWQPPRA